MNQHRSDTHGTIGNLEIMHEYLQRLNIAGGFDYCLTIFAGDNGVSQEGISSYLPFSSARIVNAHLNGRSFSRILMDRLDKPEIVVDVGLFHDVYHTGLINMKVAYATRSLMSEASLTRTEVDKALTAGKEVADMLYSQGIKVFGLGEIGVGNTISAYAIMCSLLDITPEKVVGYGSTQKNELYKRRLEVVKQACHRIINRISSVKDIMEELGSAEIVAMAGAVLGAAELGLGVVLDGFVSSVAALLATRIDHECGEILLASTLGREPGHKVVLNELSLTPMFDIGINYGEGLAAGIGLFLLEMAQHFFNREDF